ncbi:Putative inner membrane protein [Salmonella enterica subsp. arizonae]|uniref:Inner membrane protein n=1 Tax=Salmonella enterica subsp. arizonae TaxID=59203 RepID=A0A379SKH4_SALER|nr:Putative inner membrane protein [Salmonella enterica subsp. arizonae]
MLRVSTSLFMKSRINWICAMAIAPAHSFHPLRDVAGWEHDLHAAMNNIQDEIDLVGENAASIDAYAATDPAECFAVLSEYFFSAPELFAPRFPALWQRFCQFYRQDPSQRLR